MSIKEHGSRKYGRLIQQNINQAHYLSELIKSQPELQLSAPVTLNVVCFRYVGSSMDDAALDELNKQIVIELQEQGNVVISGTTIKGRYVLRAGIMNHRSRIDDFDFLIREVTRVGKDLTSSARKT
jgi:glutamate/tyrosine decarboxylase-like PLP-dependent enzyme